MRPSRSQSLHRRGPDASFSGLRALAGNPALTALALSLCVLTSTALGCGYSFVRYADALGDTRRVAIRGIANETYEPGVDHLITDALTREFHRRKALTIVSDPAQADLVIGGEVDRLETDSSSFSSIQFAVEYQVTMGLALEIRRRDGSEVAIDPNALRESEIYLASSDIEVTRKNRQEALRRVASLLAGRVHDALFERMTP